MTAPRQLMLRCELCNDPIPSAADPIHTRVAAVDHMIDAHRLRWLADGLTGALTLIHVDN